MSKEEILSKMSEDLEKASFIVEDWLTRVNDTELEELSRLINTCRIRVINLKYEDEEVTWTE